MIRCPSCTQVLPSELATCGSCNFRADTIEGFTAWAPEFAHSNSGFKAESFSHLAQMEASSFWFRARNRLIIWAISRYFPKMSSFLEVGCGTGFVLSGVTEAFPKARLVGTEIFVEGLKYAEKRVPDATLIQMDARAVPYVDEFDVAVAVDVIEHIEEDRQVLSQLYGAVRSGGGIIISVPQHKWLWSQSDDYACHVRRYDAGDLHEKIETAGFKILRSTSFVSLLLPLLLASRLVQRNSKDYDPLAEFEIPSLLNKVLEIVLNIERKLISAGINLPVGGSRFVVARKS